MAAGQQTVELKLDLALREVLRLMGNSHREPVRKDVLDMVNQLLAEATYYLSVRGTYVVRGVVRMAPDVIELEGCPTFRGPIASFLKPARRVAVFVVTVGGAIEQAAERCHRDGLAAESFVLHAIGSAAAEAACDAMVEYLWAHEIRSDEAVTAPFSPGYCGMPLTDQQNLFSILDTSGIGVNLLPSMMMRPIKSVSGLAGIGPASAVEAHGLPCEHCQIDHCRMRRPAD
jgi:hypothetical protein